MNTKTYFGSLSEYVQHVESLPWVEGNSDDPRDTWCSSTHADAVKLATYGWPEGARLASDKAMKIAARVVNKTSNAVSFNVGYDVIGAAFDAGAVALGIPEAWGILEPQVSKRAVRIVANIAVSGGVTESVITARGLAITAIALVLQSEGYPVTVDIFDGTRIGRGERNAKWSINSHVVRVADATSGSPLDIDRLAYALAHPSMFRKLNRSAVQGFRNGAKHKSAWDISTVLSDAKPEGEIDIYSGGAHLFEVERWRDGGEAWVLKEYLRQTKES